jgi:pimeloyl-ACP methyl ester carboxylesterase
MSRALIEQTTDEAIRAEYPFESCFLETAAGRLHYLDEGPKDAPPLLMLHGNPTWSFFYRRLVSALSKEHRCIVPDHLGCGLSDKPAGWSYDLAGHIANLESLVLALDLERITLVLHDWGGAIGMGVARRHPERIARLVVMNTAAFPSAHCPLRIRICRTPMLGPFLVRRLNAFAGLAPRMAVVRRLSPAARRGSVLPYQSFAARVAVSRFVRDIPLSPADPSYAEIDAICRRASCGASATSASRRASARSGSGVCRKRRSIPSPGPVTGSSRTNPSRSSGS